MRQRANVRTQRLFDENLRQRVKRPMTDLPEVCAQNQSPIREETRAYLTRPIEQDFSLVGALSYAVTCAIYLYALIQQILQITRVCSGAYVCPAASVTAGFPIVAPPVGFRNLTVLPVSTGSAMPQLTLADSMVTSSKAAWQPSIQGTCRYGEDGCSKPGYEVQWPYIPGQSLDARQCDRFSTYDVCTGDTEEPCTQQEEGRQCVFPFKYNGELYTACTTIDSTQGRPWCSFTRNYDDPVDGGQWGHCKLCKGEQV